MTTHPAALAPALRARLEQALRGGPALVVGPTPPRPVPDGIALVLTTSGSSSGRGRPVALTAAAIRAGADATHARLRGPGQWLLTLPPTHVAGAQLLARTVVAGIDPVVRGEGETLAGAVGRMRPDLPRYLSLVPTQLVRALATGGPDLDALRSLTAVLVGGAALDPASSARARQAGAPVVTTYGMTETSGGCVYDGVPLDGVRVHVDDDDRIHVAAPMLAAGYLDEGPQPFHTDDAGTRWFRTNDAGSWDERGRLRVLGRLDDVLVTGGLNVHPAAVERALAGARGVRELIVVGIPSDEWGQEVTAVMVADGAVEPPSLDQLRERVRGLLGPASAPRALVTLDALPLRGPGKPDRRAATALAIMAVLEGRAERR